MSGNIQAVPSKDDVAKALELAKAVLDVIIAAGPNGMPSGELYAHLMGKISIETYGSLIGMLKRLGLVAESNHLLTATSKGKEMSS